MNIAIIISGRINLCQSVVEKNYETIINPLIEAGHNINIFVSIWDHEDSPKFIISYKKYIKAIDIETYSEYTPAFIDKFYEFKKLIEEYRETDKLVNTLFWLYKLNRGYKLLQEYERVNNIKHDVFIRIRPDAWCDKPIDLDQISKLDNFSIILHVDQILHINNKLYGCGTGWVDDNFCIAKRIPFDVYCKIYDNIMELSTECKSCVSHIIMQFYFKRINFKLLKPNSPLVIYRDNKRTTIYFTHLYLDYHYMLC